MLQTECFFDGGFAGAFLSSASSAANWRLKDFCKNLQKTANFVPKFRSTLVMAFGARCSSKTDAICYFCRVTDPRLISLC